VRPPIAAGARQTGNGHAAPHLREHCHDDAVWITTPAFEAAGRALGLPDPARVETLLALAPAPGPRRAGRAPTRVEWLPGLRDPVHVRRVLHGGWLAPLWRGRIAGLGRVRDELAVTMRLHALGAPVPAPAFAVGRRSGPLWRAALCTVHVAGAVDAIRLLGSAPAPDAVADAARAAGAAVRRLHDLGARHADLHLGNLLLRADPEGWRAWVIDLDRARLGAPVAPARRARECRRLLRSARKRGLDVVLGAAGLEAFRDGYRAASPEAGSG
jgi:hypothetical protein